MCPSKTSDKHFAEDENRYHRYCSACGGTVSPDDRFCSACGVAVESFASTKSETDNGPLVWEARIPILTDRFMLWDLSRVIVLSLLLMTMMVAVVGVFASEGLVLLPWIAYVVGGGVVAILFAIASLVFFGNRYYAEFAVDPTGVLYQFGGRSTSAGTISFLAGVLASNPTVAGAGLIAASREVTFIPWSNVRRVRIHRLQKVISLQNDWRTLLRLYCTEENFDEVASQVSLYAADAADHQLSQSTSNAVQSDIERPRHRLLVALTTWIILCLVFAFMTRAWYWSAEDTELIILLSVVLLATAGFLGRVGWVLAIPSGVLATLALVISVAIATETSQSILGNTYYTYDLDRSAFWLAVVGYLGLMIMSTLCVVGRGPFHWAGLRPTNSATSNAANET